MQTCGIFIQNLVGEVASWDGLDASIQTRHGSTSCVKASNWPSKAVDKDKLKCSIKSLPIAVDKWEKRGCDLGTWCSKTAKDYKIAEKWWIEVMNKQAARKVRTASTFSAPLSLLRQNWSRQSSQNTSNMPWCLWSSLFTMDKQHHRKCNLIQPQSLFFLSKVPVQG